ncbi:ATP-binding cassette domain-containing protein [Paenalcaligenes niemegkensis]|uniref:ATP-binding cassette domain-containing protein n=1 Tax=Paenalcaligenes niemegkensis TaxID=2895469 RepID=UPI001EE9027F|nr:ATP-binding cassette domain-containing protein [Paenalcaligenes niemegkensis]MCQ9615554.1 ATP-binding cassette domain-containing protein [Paenalcaligenes niemegkensis]
MKLWWQLCAPWLRQHKGRVVISGFVALSTVFAGVGLLTVAGWFLTGAFLAGSFSLFNLFAPSALVRGLSMWRIASRYVERITGHTVTLDLQAEIRSQTFEQLSLLPPAELARYRDGDLVARLINDVERLDSVFLLLVVPAFTALMGGMIYAALVGSYIPWAGVAVLACVLMGALLIPFGVARHASSAGQQITGAASELRALLHDAMVAHVDIVVFNSFTAVQDNFEAQSAALSAQQSRMSAVASLGNLAQQVCMGLLVIAMLVIGIHVYSEHELSAAIWVGLLLGAMALFEIMAPLMRGAASLGVASSAAARLRAIRGQDSESESGPCDMATSGSLTLNKVYIGHDGNEPLVGAIDLVLEQGERLLIRGLSGSGKTTLLHSLIGVIAPLQGDIYYGGTSLARVPSEQRFKQFALLSQHSTVFMGTIRHNLCLAKPDATDKELWAVLERVRLASFVETLAKGLDSWVGEGVTPCPQGKPAVYAWRVFC